VTLADSTKHTKKKPMMRQEYKHSLVQSPFMTSGEETYWAYSVNPGARYCIGFMRQFCIVLVYAL